MGIKAQIFHKKTKWCRFVCIMLIYMQNKCFSHGVIQKTLFKKLYFLKKRYCIENLRRIIPLKIKKKKLKRIIIIFYNPIHFITKSICLKYKKFSTFVGKTHIKRAHQQWGRHDKTTRQKRMNILMGGVFIGKNRPMEKTIPPYPTT